MSDKESREAFKKKAVPAFVDLLQMAKQAIILYRKRETESDTPSFEEISFQEVLLTANCMVSVGFVARDAGVQTEEVVAPPSVAELVPPRLPPTQVHDAFTVELERQKLDVALSRRICAALVSTPAGHDMLKVMIYDAVMLKRKSESRPPPAETTG